MLFLNEFSFDRISTTSDAASYSTCSDCRATNVIAMQHFGNLSKVQETHMLIHVRADRHRLRILFTHLSCQLDVFHLEMTGA